MNDLGEDETITLIEGMVAHMVTAAGLPETQQSVERAWLALKAELDEYPHERIEVARLHLLVQQAVRRLLH